MSTSTTPVALSKTEHAALDRLIRIARNDTAESRRVADFLLAWWNAAQCGGFDMTNLWSLDAAIVEDVKAVFGYICRAQRHPDSLGLEEEFEAIIRTWRPEVASQIEPQ